MAINISVLSQCTAAALRPKSGSLLAFLIEKRPDRISGPLGEALVLRDVSGAGSSCLVNVFSDFLVGSGALARPLRLLAAASLLGFTRRHGMRTNVAMHNMLLAETESALAEGEAMGAPTISALSDALGVRASFTMCLSGGGRMKWDTHEPTDAISGAHIFVWHTGAFHFNHAVPAVSPPAPLHGIGPDNERIVFDAIVQRALFMMAAIDAPTDTETRLLDRMRDAVSALGAAQQSHTSSIAASTADLHDDEASDASLEEGTEEPTAAAAGKKRRSHRDAKVQPANFVSWSAVLATTLDFPGIVDVSPAGLQFYNANKRIRCIVAGCSKVIAANRTSIKSHHTVHKNRGELSKGTQPALPFLAPSSDTDHVRVEAQEMCLMALSAAALPYRVIEKVSALIPLLALAGSLPSAASLSRPGSMIDTGIAKTQAAIRRKLNGAPLVLVFDGGITGYSGGTDELVVLADSITFESAVLLDVIDLKHRGKHASALASAIRTVMADYGIASDYVVGVAADTTAVMPAAVRELGFTYLPCWAHVGNLMIRAIYEAMELSDLMLWRSLLSKSNARVSELAALGLNPNALRVPEHRFTFWQLALMELCPSSTAAHDWSKWTRYAEWLKAFSSRRRGRTKDSEGATGTPEQEAYARAQTAALKALLAAMPARMSRAKAWIALQLTMVGADIVRLAESSARNLPPDMTARLRAWLDSLVYAYNNAMAFVDGELRRISVEASPTERAELVRMTQVAVENADKKVRSHLQDTSKKFDFALLEPYERRDRFVAPSMRDFRMPITTPSTLQLMLGQYVDLTLIAECSALNAALEAWEERVLPTEHANDPVAFWLAMRERTIAPRITAAALRALSVVLSNTAAERTFSILRNFEGSNRLHAGHAYVRKMLMSSHNRDEVHDVYAARAAELTGASAAMFARAMGRRVRKRARRAALPVQLDADASDGDGSGASGAEEDVHVDAAQRDADTSDAESESDVANIEA